MNAWNGTPVGEIDAEWREWYESGGFMRAEKCGKTLPDQCWKWVCTLERYHIGTCVAHTGDAPCGKVLEIAEQWDVRMNVPEGL